MSATAHRLSFVYEPAEDETVDPQYAVYLDGEKTSYSIQNTYGVFSVNKEGWEVPGDATSYFVIFFDEEYRVLGQAKDRVLELIEADLANAPSEPTAGI